MEIVANRERSKNEELEAQTRKKSCQKEIDKDLYNREKVKEIEYEENDLAKFLQKVLSYCDAIFCQITKRREETPGTDDANYKICKTKNKVNILEVYQKNKVMPEESLCGNSDRKVLIIEKRFLDVDNSIAKELGKDRRKVEEKTKSDLKVQVELKSFYLKKSGLKRNSNGVGRN
ncbi:hypothetical protein F8M41_025226 [Gigaspora margarita]|uniref:Uncharacterized protein n=1 Tax=Gigaspora margarita TaxID=4874 RepID=A0A8H3XIU1_GIGMA|nr:hypothetical protein F8M41_025226 [Gigaspora margarita]